MNDVMGSAHPMMRGSMTRGRLLMPCSLGIDRNYQRHHCEPSNCIREDGSDRACQGRPPRLLVSLSRVVAERLPELSERVSTAIDVADEMAAFVFAREVWRPSTRPSLCAKPKGFTAPAYPSQSTLRDRHGRKDEAD